MLSKLYKLEHCTYICQYHIVWTPRYRGKVLADIYIKAELKRIFKFIVLDCRIFGVVKLLSVDPLALFQRPFHPSQVEAVFDSIHRHLGEYGVKILILIGKILVQFREILAPEIRMETWAIVFRYYGHPVFGFAILKERFVWAKPGDNH